MDHNRAVELQAVERYLLGELAPEERDSFEEHFFTCEECALHVRHSARFRANARGVLQEIGQEVREPRRPGWLSWTSLVPIAASVVLLGVVAYQNAVVLPALRAPRALGAALTLDGATRGALPEIEKGGPVDIQMALPPGTEGGVVTELADESGKVLTRGSTGKPLPDQPYHVYFPDEYRPGRYRVIVRDAATGRELVQNQFEIAAKETN